MVESFLSGHHRCKNFYLRLIEMSAQQRLFSIDITLACIHQSVPKGQLFVLQRCPLYRDVRFIETLFTGLYFNIHQSVPRMITQSYKVVRFIPCPFQRDSILASNCDVILEISKRIMTHLVFFWLIINTILFSMTCSRDANKDRLKDFLHTSFLMHIFIEAYLQSLSFYCCETSKMLRIFTISTLFFFVLFLR